MRGIEKIWFIGDEFSHSSFEHHFKDIKDEHGKYTTFTFDNYEVRDFLSSRVTSHIRSTLARFRNNLVKAMNDQIGLPKLIVVVMDDDILKSIEGDTSEDVRKQIKPLITWLICEYEKLILAFKDMLPGRAKRHHVPHVLWMRPATHKNFGNSWNMLREELGQVLKECADMKSNMSSLQMLKVWDSEDSSLFRYDNYRFTAEGLKKYWLSIDSAVRFWCTAIASKIEAKKGKRPPFRRDTNPFRWQKNYTQGRRLPTPP